MKKSVSLISLILVMFMLMLSTVSCNNVNIVPDNLNGSEIKEVAYMSDERVSLGITPMVSRQSNYKESPLLASFHLISDVHVPKANDVYISALQNMANINSSTNIGLVIAGDNTNSGTADQFKEFYELTEKYSPVSPQNTAIVLGNHDVRKQPFYNDPADYDPSKSNWANVESMYMQYNEDYMANSRTVYHSKVLGGYTFIMLNTELDLSDNSYMTNAQLEWLERTLKRAYYEDPNKPVFIVSHQPLYETHLKSNDELNPFLLESLDESLTRQESSDKIKAVLAKYPQSIFLSGHLHNNLTKTRGVIRDYGAAVDIPSLTLNQNYGGYEVMIYDNVVKFRAINYVTGEYLPDYDIIIPVGEDSVSAIYQEARSILDAPSGYPSSNVEEIAQLYKKLGDQIGITYSSVSDDKFFTAEHNASINKFSQQLKTAILNLKAENSDEENSDAGNSDAGNEKETQSVNGTEQEDTVITDTGETTNTDVPEDRGGRTGAIIAAASIGGLGIAAGAAALVCTKKIKRKKE